MYRVLITATAEKDLNKIVKNNRRRILQKIKDFSETPLLYSKKLKNPLIGTYRFRIGHYRVIFDIEGEDLVILRIRHRKDIYK